MFYSLSRSGFYDRNIHGLNIPADAVEISKGQHASLVEGLAAGKLIALGRDGLPTLVDPPIYEPTVDDHLAAVSAMRYEKETAGITVEGMAIDSARDSQALITGAAVAAMLDSSYRCRWKTPAGFVDLSAAQIIAMASAVRAHVQACFDREGALLEAIAAGTYSPAMLEEGWP